MTTERKLLLKEIQEIELGILRTFNSICVSHKIKYSLAYGTLLGAVRHGGFIPWDDDIDVMIPRDDYYRFIEVCNKELLGTNYAIISSETCADYFSPLAKMFDVRTKVYQQYGQKENYTTGVYIDIFVVDNLPETNQEAFYNTAKKIRMKWGLSCRDLFAKHQSKNAFRDFCGNLISIIYKFRGTIYYRNQYISHCSKFKNIQTKEIAVVIYGEGLERERMVRNEFDSLRMIKFENDEYYCIQHPEIYLSQMYGNYMQLPPVEKRVSKHPNIAVMIE